MKKIITKRRGLAKNGIGDPLNILMYSSKEIQGMKDRGEIKKVVIAKKLPKLGKRSKHGRFIVQARQGERFVTVETLRFATKLDAYRWAMWNYKHKEDRFRLAVLKPVPLENPNYYPSPSRE